MAACAHGAGYESCPPSKVSTEFNQADKGSPMLSRAMRERSAERRVRKQFGGAMSMAPGLAAMGGNYQGGQNMRPQTGNLDPRSPMGQPGYQPPQNNFNIAQALQALQGRGGTVGAGNMAGWLGGGGFQGAGGMGRAIPQGGGIPWGGRGGFGPGIMKGAGDMMARPGQGAFRGPIGPPGRGGMMGGAAPTGAPNPVARPGTPGGPPTAGGAGGQLSPQMLQGIMSRMGAGGGGGAPPAFQAPPGAGQPVMNACSVPATMMGGGAGGGGGKPPGTGLWGGGPGSFGYMGGTLAPGAGGPTPNTGGAGGMGGGTVGGGLAQLLGQQAQGQPNVMPTMPMGMMGMARGGRPMLAPPGIPPMPPTGAPGGSPLPMAKPPMGGGLASLIGGAMAGRHAGFPGPRKPRIPMPGSLRNINQPINRTRGLGPP